VNGLVVKRRSSVRDVVGYLVAIAIVLAMVSVRMS
jgi:hypothetical protein